MPTSLVQRGLHMKQHKCIPPSSNVFSCVQGFPCFRKPGFLPGKFMSHHRFLLLLSTHEQRGSSLSLPTISFLRALADEPWQISCNVTLPGVEARCVPTAQSHQFTACCAVCSSPAHNPCLWEAPVSKVPM